MKLKLTLAQAAQMALVQGAVQLRDNIPVSGDQAVLLDRACDQIITEHKRYHKLRNTWIEKNGDKVGDGHFGIPPGDSRLEKLFRYEGELGRESFDVRIVKKLKLPEHFSITASQYRALKDAGILEEIEVPEEKDEEPDGAQSAQEKSELPTKKAAK